MLCDIANSISPSLTTCTEEIIASLLPLICSNSELTGLDFMESIKEHPDPIPNARVVDISRNHIQLDVDAHNGHIHIRYWWTKKISKINGVHKLQSLLESVRFCEITNRQRSARAFFSIALVKLGTRWTQHRFTIIMSFNKWNKRRCH